MYAFSKTQPWPFLRPRFPPHWSEDHWCTLKLSWDSLKRILILVIHHPQGLS